MTNVVALRGQRPGPHALFPALPALVDIFATRRRTRHDAYWLKENAELVQILAATEAQVDLAAYRRFGPGLMDELRFFPQYYRLILSFALDLAALGVPDVPVGEMAAHVVDQGLMAAELSDSHRAEARLLLARSGCPVAEDAGTTARLGAFARQSAQFSLPNRRAAYDLTHIVFHATDYGRRTVARDADRRRSLIYAGCVAWLEDNLDLLAEIIIALHLSGEAVPEVWRNAVIADVARFGFEAGPDDAPLDDDCHAFLVQNWALACFGGAAFAGSIPQGARMIRAAPRQGAALRELSVLLFDMGDARLPDWSRMRWRLWPRLSEASRARIAAIEDIPEFAGFFAGFSRCKTVRRVA